jgi:isoleucyl-tRNA synthetase
MITNYKETLNILKTDFEMKANLSIKEPKIESVWNDQKIYQKILNQNKNNEQ